MRRKILDEVSPALLEMIEAFNWAKPSAQGLSIAAYVDDGAATESDLGGCVTTSELAKAELLTNPAERRHFLTRRCFQRLFVCLVTGWNASPRELRLEHKLDTQPNCLDFPSLHLSFSTSGAAAVACASKIYTVGIDVERIRMVENANQLARRFFSQKEADAIAAMSPDEQSHHFLLHWTAKEAGLKAIGQGIVSGLNAFCLQRKPPDTTYSVIGPSENHAAWILQNFDILPNHIIALIKKNSVDNY